MEQLFQALKDHPRAVILDTDIGPDCDDVGALVTLIHYAKEYDFPILGVCNCTSNKAGNGAIDAVFRHCGLPTPAIGQWSGDGFLDDPACHKYNDAIAEKFSPAYRAGTLSVEGETAFYRRLLAGAADDGVVIVTIGMFNCLAALLRSGPDAYSPLTGLELVRQKVHSLVSMATLLPQGREYNIVCDVPAARAVLAAWPTPIVLSDARLGASLVTGYGDITDPEAIAASPLPMAYHLYTREREENRGNNCSFDLTAVQFAALGEGELYSLDQPGRLEFYEEIPGQCDATRFIPDPAGSCRYMVKHAPDAEIVASINAILHSF